MRLENIVWDAADPQRLGCFWAAALGARPMTDTSMLFEARLDFGSELFLDLCLPRVAPTTAVSPRLHVGLDPGPGQAKTVDRLVALGAVRRDTGQPGVGGIALVDPEGNAFSVLPDTAHNAEAGPIISLQLDSADPGRDAAFWAAITGGQAVSGASPAIRPLPGRGPWFGLCAEPNRKSGKNAIHLDVRAEPKEVDAVGYAVSLGAAIVSDAQSLAWVVMTDPSGNEFCILDAPSAAVETGEFG